MGELKTVLEVGDWAETFEPHNIAVKAPRRGETLGKTVVPVSVARTLMRTLKDEKVRESLAQLPKEERKNVEADIVWEAVTLKGKDRQEFLKGFVKDPLKPPEEIKREVLAPAGTQPILITLPIRVENEVYEPLKRYALDSNLGDRVAYAAKNLISEGLASRGYLSSTAVTARSQQDAL